MQRSSFLFASVVGFVLAMGAAQGCQEIAGIQTRTTDPLLTGCNLPGVAGSPSTGNGRIRLVNLGTSAANADFCLRPSGTTSWGRPVFRDGGNDALCLGGLKYQASTVPFSVPVGKIDVKAIPAGQTCAATATSELNGIAIGEAVPVSVVRWGNAATEALSALPEELAPRPSDGSQYRIVNALANAKPINVGLAVTPFVPTTLGSVAYSQPLSPGGVEPSSTGPLGTVDSDGYLQIISEAFQFGASLASDSANNAIVVFDTNSADTATMYVGGDPADNTHPVQGLYCSDEGSIATAVEETGSDDAGTPAGGVALTAQDEALLAQCTPTLLPLISVDTFNVGLYGGDSPFPQARAPAIYAAIAARTSDVMCVVEVDQQSDRTNIASSAAAWYPNTYSIPTDLDTTPTLPADVVSPPTAAPCASSVVSSSVLCSSAGYTPPCEYVAPGATPATTSIYGCMGANCSSIPNDSALAGTIVTDTCVSEQCTAPFLSIYGSTVAQDNCYDCIVYYFTSDLPIGLGLSSCSGDTRRQFAFLGQTPEMILSHYPLSNQHAYILPSTGFRRAVLQATVTLENNQKFDFFCAQLTAPGNKNKLPYTGSYGTNDNEENGWQDEQDLQTKEAIAFIQQQTKTDGLPAIITGDWHSDNGDANADAGAGVLRSVSPEVVTALEGAFVQAVPGNTTPVCDYCPASQNPYNNTVPLEFLWTFLTGFPASSTQSSTVWGTAGNAVTIPPVSGTGNTSGEVAPPGNVGPLSPYYPRNVTVLRPPTQ